MVKVHITLDVSKLPNFEDLGNKLQERSMNLISQTMLRNLQNNSPYRHGHLKKWAPSKSGNMIRITTPAQYAKYVNDGTGLYGPYKTPIYSKHIGHPMAFQVGGKMVYTKMIKGIKPRKFVEKSMEETQSKIEGLVIKAVREVLNE